MSDEKKKQIHWQKFEESIKEQVDSNLISEIFKIVSKQVKKEVVDTDSYNEYEYEDKMYSEQITPHVSLSEDLMEDVSIAGRFDCWVGHSNFSITPKVAKKIAKVDGIEALKIITRYRFLIGIGKMFDFKDVCQDILETTGVKVKDGHKSENNGNVQ